MHQAHRDPHPHPTTPPCTTPPPLGPYSVDPCGQAHGGVSLAGVYSVVQCLRCLMGQPLLLLMLVRGAREAIVMTPHTMCDSVVSLCSHDCLTFLHRHFPPQFTPSYPLDLSLCHQQQLHNCSTIPKLQLPASAPSRGPASLSGVCMTAARTV